MRWRASVLALGLALLASVPAGAQWGDAEQKDASHSKARWLVIPVRGGGTDGAPELSIDALHLGAESVRHELSVRGEEVWRAERASERFETVGSAPAPDVSESDIERWVERSRAAVRYLARADYKAARRELKAAQRLADRAAEELNREAARAQQVLDTCLFMVRAYIETHDDAEARRQARECRHLVPRVEPSAFRHTPEVRALLADVDAEMAAEAPGMLSVTSTLPGCLVRINGVELGRTPLSGIELPVGTYRFQVECTDGVRGRIHREVVESGDNVFSFDGALDQAVHTRPVLFLAYDSRGAWEEMRMAHAAAVGDVLQVQGVVTVSALGATEARLDLRAAGFAPASVWVRVQDGVIDSEEARRAVDALFEGRSVDFTGAHPLARPSWAALSTLVEDPAPVADEPPSEPAARGTPRPRPQRIAGWTLLGAGMASIGASVGLHVWRGNLGDQLVDTPASVSAAQRWYDARIGVWTTAAFGGAAASAAMPLVLPDYEKTPWWGWTMGALGLGLTGYAVYEGVTMTECPEPFLTDGDATRACVTRGQQAGRVALALAGAAPLLTAPLVYLFRPLRAAPSVSVTRSTVVVQIHKAF